jgi:PPOX class probable F420-dependent enzyme
MGWHNGRTSSDVQRGFGVTQPSVGADERVRTGVGPGVGDAVRELLDLRLIATLATSNEDGSILLTPIWYVFDGGRFFFGTSSASRKVRNVEARPKVSLVVDQRRAGGNQWASARGTAEVIRGDAAQAINAKIRARYLTEAGERAYGRVLVDADDIVIAVTPESWRSWKPGLLAKTAAERGWPSERLEEWFHPLD